MSAPEGPAFADHFSTVAPDYSRFRPRYPDALFAWLAAQAPQARVAWDCATGSGQAALGLAAHVPLVVASDASRAQLAAAAPHPRVRYLVSLAERTPLRPGSMDIVTVGQALHWFDIPAFAAEATRVTRAGGVVAAWAYGRPSVSPGVDAVLGELMDGVLGAYWPPERALVESGYAGVPFPFTGLAAPPLEMEARWTLHDLLGFVASWSASAAYRRAHGTNPAASLLPALAAAWGDPGTTRRVRWPLTVLAGVRGHGRVSS